MRNFGIDRVTHTESSLRKFMEFDEPRQEKILKEWKTTLSILKEAISSGADGLELEKNMIRSALRIYGLKVDEDCLNFFKSGDVIEMYNMDMIQLYRNVEFFKNCSYDLLTLSCYEWHVLYERSEVMTKDLLDRAIAILSSDATKPVNYELPPHTMRERHLDAKKVFEVEMKTCLPIRDPATHQVIAFLHSVESRLVASGSEASKVSHL